MNFPSLTHVALTVTDLSVSVPWYTRLFGADPVLDEDTGPFRHVVWALGGTLVGPDTALDAALFRSNGDLLLAVRLGVRFQAAGR